MFSIEKSIEQFESFARQTEISEIIHHEDLYKIMNVLKSLPKEAKDIQYNSQVIQDLQNQQSQLIKDKAENLERFTKIKKEAESGNNSYFSALLALIKQQEEQAKTDIAKQEKDLSEQLLTLNPCAYLREKLITILLKEHTEENKTNNNNFQKEVYNAVHHTLVALAKYSPLNENDYFTNKLPQNPVYISTGHQLELEESEKYLNIGTSDLLNPYTNQLFNSRDVSHILQEKEEAQKITEIKELRQNNNPTAEASLNQDTTAPLPQSAPQIENSRTTLASFSSSSLGVAGEVNYCKEESKRDSNQIAKIGLFGFDIRFNQSGDKTTLNIFNTNQPSTPDQSSSQQTPQGPTSS